MAPAKTMKARRKKKRRKLMREKRCRLCENKVTEVTFKDVDVLRRYQTEQGKILPRRITGNCFKHQKMLAQAIKRARVVGLVL